MNQNPTPITISNKVAAVTLTPEVVSKILHLAINCTYLIERTNPLTLEERTARAVIEALQKDFGLEVL